MGNHSIQPTLQHPDELDFERFHSATITELIHRNIGLVGHDLDGAAPLALTVDDASFTYRAAHGSAGRTVTVEAGVADDAAAEVGMSAPIWHGFVSEMRTSFGLLYGNELEARRGSPELLIRWEPALRALYHGRPIYDPDHVELLDRQGQPLDLHRVFTLDDDLADLAHFFEQAGFAHVRGVVGDEDRAEFMAEVDRLRAEARPGDNLSWWAHNRDGEAMVCRLTYVATRSEALGRAHQLPAIRRLVEALSPDGVEMVTDLDRQEGNSVVIKVPAAADGLANLPWHADCGLGGHPILCPSIQVGIQLNAASPGAGQLHFLAGSHNHSTRQPTDAQIATGRYPTVAVTTEPGDVTLHAGDVLHAAPPPSGADEYRATLYVSWHPAIARTVIGPGESYNDVVLRSGSDNVALSVPEALAAN